MIWWRLLKISSGNIVLNLEQLNLTELLNQAVGGILRQNGREKAAGDL